MSCCKKIKNLSSLLPLVLTTSLFGNPTGASVQSGSATVTESGGNMTVNIGSSSTTNVINWTSYSIGVGESVTYTQTGGSTDYYVLNNVTGSSASTIAGSLFTDSEFGHIYLYNAAGIIIPGTVQVGSFVGTTLGLSGTFAPTSSMTFSGTSTNPITVAGTVEAINGDVSLISYGVTCSGTLTASAAVSIGAGASVMLVPTNSERVVILAAGTTAAANGIYITSTGTLEGDGVNLIAAGNPYTLAINLDGVINATGCSSSDGAVVLTASPITTCAGAIDIASTATIQRTTTSGYGPDLTINGDTIAIYGTIDLSGETGGGDLTIGAEGSTCSTSNIYIASSATLTTDALTLGNGGNITMWAEDSLLYLGAILSRGAGTGGNGGAASLTSPGYLGLNGTANLGVTGSGTVGTFSGITSAMNVGAAANYGSNFAPPSYTIAAVPSIVTPTSLQAMLAVSNVTLNADGTNTTGNLDFQSDITWSSGRRLTLIADALINVNYDVTMTGSVTPSQSVVSLTAPIITIGLEAQTQTTSSGFDLTSGSMSATASDYMALYGGAAANAYSRFNTASGNNTISFDNALDVLAGESAGANAEIRGTTVTVNGIAAGTGDISIIAGDCSSAFINGSTVSIGVTTSPANLTIQGGSCSTDNEAYVGSLTGGSTITIAVTEDVELIGGVSGSGNKASIISSSGGSANAVTITAQDVVLTGGSGGSNNSARIASLGSLGSVSITTTQDLLLNGGGSGSTASSGFIQAILIDFTTARDTILTGGAGLQNRAYMQGSSQLDGTIGRNFTATGGTANMAYAEIRTVEGDLTLNSSTTSSIFTFQGGSSGTINSYARANVLGDGDILIGNTAAPNYLNLIGGSAATDVTANTFAEISIVGEGNIAITTLTDVNVLGGGTSLDSHAGISAQTGNVTITAGRSANFTTGTDPSADSFATSANGAVNVTATGDITLTGSCTIPNTAYLISNGSNSALFVSASNDLIRRGLTIIANNGSGSGLTISYGNQSFNYGCSTPTPLLGGSQYYSYTFLYELFYRMRYFTYMDWFEFLSENFWNSADYTDP